MALGRFKQLPRRSNETWQGGTAAIIAHMRTLCWLLIGLAALAFTVGTIVAFAHQTFLLEPVGYWRGAVGFLLFAIAIRMMDSSGSSQR